MAKKKAYKYSVYNAVSKKLKLDGIAENGVTTTILLETFLERRGTLKAAHVSGKKLIGDDTGLTFKQWRQKLQDLGWIEYDDDYAARTKRYSDHQPGHKLKEYLNIEKNRVCEIATMDDIREIHLGKADRSEVEELNARIEALEKRLAASEMMFKNAVIFMQRSARAELGPAASRSMIDTQVRDWLSVDDENEAALEKELLAN